MSICPRAGAWGQSSQIFRFFNSGYAYDGNIWIFRRRASRVTVNTLIKSNYASVRQSRDSLHRDRHNGPEKKSKKVAAAPCSETAWAKSSKKHGDVFCGTLLCLWIWCKSIKNWRRYSTKTAIMDNCNDKDIKLNTKLNAFTSEVKSPPFSKQNPASNVGFLSPLPPSLLFPPSFSF